MNRTDVRNVWHSENAIHIELTDGRQAEERYSDYTRLANASKSQRENYELTYFGIHWPEIDEDLSYAGFFQKF